MDRFLRALIHSAVLANDKWAQFHGQTRYLRDRTCISFEEVDFDLPCNFEVSDLRESLMNRKGAIRGIMILGFAASLSGGAMLPSHAAAASCGGGGPAGDGGAAVRMGCPAADGAKGCCGQGGGGIGYGAGKRMRGGPGGAHHENIHALLDQHEAIQREVKEVEGGVETVTTSEDPEVVEIIREHVREMQQRVESGHGLRWWDPTFAELFRNYDKIEMQIEDVPGGVRVLETSNDPDVAMLIRQHAIRGVSEFVAEGHARARKPTPLPEGYNTKDENSRTGE